MLIKCKNIIYTLFIYTIYRYTVLSNDDQVIYIYTFHKPFVNK